jgi:hypothetical protein
VLDAFEPFFRGHWRWLYWLLLSYLTPYGCYCSLGELAGSSYARLCGVVLSASRSNWSSQSPSRAQRDVRNHGARCSPASVSFASQRRAVTCAARSPPIAWEGYDFKDAG